MENDEQQQQELFFRFSMFEQQIKELQQQIESVERGIVDLTSLNFGLDELVGAKDKEIFAPLGKGIFVKAKLVSEELNVDIGKGNFIKKSIPETKAMIEEQIKKLEGIKKELENSAEEIGKEINSLMENQEPHHCEHCGEECSCEEGECGCEKD